MNSQIALFAILAFAAIFAMASPMDYAMAESTPMLDSEEENGEYEGKVCPFKEKKTASYDAELNI